MEDLLNDEGEEEIVVFREESVWSCLCMGGSCLDSCIGSSWLGSVVISLVVVVVKCKCEICD